MTIWSALKKREAKVIVGVFAVLVATGIAMHPFFWENKVRYEQALRFEEDGKLEDAIERLTGIPHGSYWYGNAVKRIPDLHKRQALKLAADRDFVGAVEHMELFDPSSPKIVDWHVELGTERLIAHDPDGAVAEFEVARYKGPLLARARAEAAAKAAFVAADELANSGQYRKAIKRVASIPPTSPFYRAGDLKTWKAKWAAEQAEERIKAEMGGHYWKVDLGAYSYVLEVNAPDADQAHTAVIEGLQSYATNNFLPLWNAVGQFRSAELDSVTVVDGGSRASIDGDIKVSWDIKATGKFGESYVSYLTHSVVLHKRNGRYKLGLVLENFGRGLQAQ